MDCPTYPQDLLSFFGSHSSFASCSIISASVFVVVFFFVFNPQINTSRYGWPFGRRCVVVIKVWNYGFSLPLVSSSIAEDRTEEWARFTTAKPKVWSMASLFSTLERSSCWAQYPFVGPTIQLWKPTWVRRLEGALAWWKHRLWQNFSPFWSDRGKAAAQMGAGRTLSQVRIGYMARPKPNLQLKSHRHERGAPGGNRLYVRRYPGW